jgi:predicted acyltransferase (DUF342 family)
MSGDIAECIARELAFVAGEIASIDRETIYGTVAQRKVRLDYWMARVASLNEELDAEIASMNAAIEGKV